MIAYPAGKLTEMVGQYICEKTGMSLTPGMYQALMIVNDNRDFVGGVVFTNWRKTNVEISCASETPMAFKPGVCRAVFQYAFDQLGCIRCTSITTKANKKARSFLEALGFQLEGNIRLGYDGRRDALIYGLLRSECRFLADESGKDLDGQGRRDGTDTPRSDSDGGGAGEGKHDSGGNAGEPRPD